MLGRIVETVAEQKPDALVISGDIYHTGQPSAAAVSMFSGTLARMRIACPDMAIVVTAGNHDSASKLVSNADLLGLLNMHAFGSLDTDNLDNHIINVNGRGYIVAVPYVNSQLLASGVIRELLDRVSVQNIDNLPVVLMAHTTVTGSDARGHDNATELTVGGICGIDISALGTGYDYAALGHIHKPQWISSAGTGRARYSGSPLAVNFDETFPHGVSVIELPGHDINPECHVIEIKPLRPLVTIPATGYSDWDSVKSELANFPGDIDAYIRLNVAVEDCLPATANDEIDEIIASKKCRFCLINAHRDEFRTNKPHALTASELMAKAPIDILEIYLSGIGRELTDEIRELFDLTVSSLEEDNRK